MGIAMGMSSGARGGGVAAFSRCAHQPGGLRWHSLPSDGPLPGHVRIARRRRYANGEDLSGVND
jgi:hypothetical protein